jgi:hypothetical protein
VQQERGLVTRAEILARLEWALEALGDGDQAAAVAVLLDLRDELRVDEERAA